MIIRQFNYNSIFPTDSTAFIVNEAAVQQMGFKHPLGQMIEWKGKPFHIVGVIKNIIFESPYTIASSPSIFHIPTYPFDYRFVDQEYAKKFSEEEQIGKISANPMKNLRAE
jgi:putative ABC transport system permease protein